jgi:hypothetical protein
MVNSQIRCGMSGLYMLGMDHREGERQDETLLLVGLIVEVLFISSKHIEITINEG